MVSVLCFLLALFFYATSTLGYVAHWGAGSQRGERLARFSLVMAVIFHGAAIVLRWVEAGYAPLSNAFEAFSFYAWGLALLYLLVRPLRRHSVLGVFVTPLALISILVAS